MNQVAIITGAAQGIGFEIARQLAAGGASVVINDIDEARLAQAAERINKEGTCRAISGALSTCVADWRRVSRSEAHKGSSSDRPRVWDSATALRPPL